MPYNMINRRNTEYLLLDVDFYLPLTLTKMYFLFSEEKKIVNFFTVE